MDAWTLQILGVSAGQLQFRSLCTVVLAVSLFVCHGQPHGRRLLNAIGRRKATRFGMVVHDVEGDNKVPVDVWSGC